KNLSNFGWTKFAAFHNTYLKLKNITLFKLLIRTIFGEAYKFSRIPYSEPQIVSKKIELFKLRKSRWD
ncbi:hypothetical protein, partial [Flectobacillus rivi]